jgi:hypothetical protein
MAMNLPTLHTSEQLLTRLSLSSSPVLVGYHKIWDNVFSLPSAASPQTIHYKNQFLQFAIQHNFTIGTDLFLDPDPLGLLTTTDDLELPPGLGGAIQAAIQFHGLIVPEISHLSRRVAVFLKVLRLLHANEKPLVICDTGVTLGPGESLPQSYFASFSKWELRYSSAAQAPKKKAFSCMGRVPYGWRRTGERDAQHRLIMEPVPEQQDVIKAIVCYRRADWQFARIARFLNDCNVPTPSGKGPWKRNNVESIYRRASVLHQFNQ